MSHFTTIRTEIKDIDALRAAVEELGLALESKTEARGYAGNLLNQNQNGVNGEPGDAPAGDVFVHVFTITDQFKVTGVSPTVPTTFFVSHFIKSTR